MFSVINPSADLETERSLMLLSRRSGLLISALQPFTNEGHLSLCFVNLHYRTEHQLAQAGLPFTELDADAGGRALLKDTSHSHLQGQRRKLLHDNNADPHESSVVLWPRLIKSNLVLSFFCF